MKTALEQVAANPATSPAIRTASMINAAFWSVAAETVQRGSGTPWFRLSSTPSEMTYQCDEKLGTPQEADCDHIQWNQLGPASISPPSDVVTVGPGNTLFLNYSKSKTDHA